MDGLAYLESELSDFITANDNSANPHLFNSIVDRVFSNVGALENRQGVERITGTPADRTTNEARLYQDHARQLETSANPKGSQQIHIYGNARAIFGTVILQQRCSNCKNREKPKADSQSVSPFDMPLYAPASYTIDTASPPLYVYFGQNLVDILGVRVDAYLATMTKASGRRLRVFVLAVYTSPVDSEHTRSITSGPVTDRECWPTLDQALLNRMAVWLTRRTDDPQDFCVRVQMNSSNDSQTLRVDGHFGMKPFRHPFPEAVSHMNELSRTVRTWNCAWHDERTLDIRPWYPQRQSPYFLARINTTADLHWVTFVRLFPASMYLDDTYYTMWALHDLQGVQSVASFLGAVHDENGILIGYLVDYGQTGSIRWHLDRENDNGRSLSLPRRIKWCGQILNTVANVHEKGHVIGTLGSSSNIGLAIDKQDNFVIYNGFQPTFVVPCFEVGGLPPEYSKAKKDEGPLQTTFKTDVYHLGLLLWRLINDKMHGQRRDFGLIHGCVTGVSGEICHETHVEPIELPLLDCQLPLFLQDIIHDCRRPDPKHRPTARQLAARFQKFSRLGPYRYYFEDPDGRSQLPLGPAGPTTIRVYNCDRCGVSTHTRWFHCTSCNAANFDLCPLCVTEGGHCFDKSHALQEYFLGDREGRVHRFGDAIVIAG